MPSIRKSMGVVPMALLLSAVTASSTGVAVELPALSLQQQWQQVEQQSFDLKLARNNLRLAADDIDINMWEESSIVLSGTTTQALDDGDSDSETITLEASLPVESRLELGAELTTDSSTGIFARYKPYAQDDVTPEMMESYLLARLTLQYTEQSLRDELEASYLDLIVAEKESEIAELELKIAIESEVSIRGAFDLGEASSTSLIDAQKETIDARQELYSARVALAEARQIYQELLGDDRVAELGSAVDFSELTDLVTRRQEAIETLDERKANTEALSKLKIELESLKTQLDNIYGYDPGLELSLSYSLDDNSVTAGFSMDLSPGQFGRDDQYDTGQLITLKQMEIKEGMHSLKVQLNVYRKKIDIARAALESNAQALEQQQINVDEAEFLSTVGERTSIEVAQQHLAQTLARQTTFVALVDLYQAQSELAALF